MRNAVTYPRVYDEMGNLGTLGDGISLDSLWQSAQNALPGALDQGLKSVEGNIASSILSNQQVQAAASTQAQKTAVDKLAAWILAHKKELTIAGGVVGLYAAYKILK